MQEVCRLTVGAQPACPTLVARPRPWPKTSMTHEEWSKTVLKSAPVRAESRASATMRRLERPLCAYIRYHWQRPWPGAFPFHAASQNSSFVQGDCFFVFGVLCRHTVSAATYRNAYKWFAVALFLSLATHVYTFQLFFLVLPSHSQRANCISNAHRWCAVIGKPRSARLELISFHGLVCGFWVVMLKQS